MEFTLHLGHVRICNDRLCDKVSVCVSQRSNESFATDGSTVVSIL